MTAAEKLMISTMARYDPSHDAFHVQRVRRTALHLARAVTASEGTSKPDLLTVELAALLHDVLDKKYVTQPRQQTLTRSSARFSSLLLPRLGLI